MREIDCIDPSLTEPRSKLRVAFRPAHENSRVAAWLFATDNAAFNSVFHSDFILPPHAFQNAMAVQISQKFSPAQLTDIPAAFVSEMLRHDSNDDDGSFLSIHTLFIPSKCIDDVVVGYMFCLGQPVAQSGESPFLPDSSPDPVGRFVYHRTYEQFLGLVNSAVSDNICVIAHAWQGVQREKYIFTIPRRKYSFDRMPDTVLSVLSNEEYRLSCPKFEYDSAEDTPCTLLDVAQARDIANDAFSSPIINCDFDAQVAGDILDSVSLGATYDSMDGLFHLDQHDSSVCGLAPLPSSGDSSACTTVQSSSNLQPPSLLGNKHLQQTVGRVRTVPRKAARKPFSAADGFGMSEMLESLGEIERTFKGTFYGPQITKQEWNPNTQQLIRSITGEYRAVFETTSIMHAKQLKQMAAHLYYAALLSSVTDKKLMFRQLQNDISAHSYPLTDGAQTEDVNRQGGSDDNSQASKRPRIMPNTTLAPRPCAYPIVPSGALPNRAGEHERDANAAREEKLEAKRRKNRLSAARSNQKRKEKWEAQKKELETLRKRVEQLEQKKSALSEENDDLKRQVAQQQIASA